MDPPPNQPPTLQAVAYIDTHQKKNRLSPPCTPKALGMLRQAPPPTPSITPISVPTVVFLSPPRRRYSSPPPRRRRPTASTSGPQRIPRSNLAAPRRRTPPPATPRAGPRRRSGWKGGLDPVTRACLCPPPSLGRRVVRFRVRLRGRAGGASMQEGRGRPWAAAERGRTRAGPGPRLIPKRPPDLPPVARVSVVRSGWAIGDPCSPARAGRHRFATLSLGRPAAPSRAIRMHAGHFRSKRVAVRRSAGSASPTRRWRRARPPPPLVKTQVV